MGRQRTCHEESNLTVAGEKRRWGGWYSQGGIQPDQIKVIPSRVNNDRVGEREVAGMGQREARLSTE